MYSISQMFIVPFQMNLSFIRIDNECDNTTILPPRVAPRNGSSLTSVDGEMVNTNISEYPHPTSANYSALEDLASNDSLVSDTLGSNNQSRISGPAYKANVANTETIICVSEFLSSFPDVSTFAMKCITQPRICFTALASE